MLVISAGACHDPSSSGPSVVVAIITPSSVTVAAGTELQLTATGQDANGKAVRLATTWDAVAGGGTITNLGRFTAGTATGTFAGAVRVTSGGLSNLVTIVVTPGPLASITVVDNPARVMARGTRAFSATGHDAYGNEIVVSPVWSVVGGGGTIDAGTGLFTADKVAGAYPNTVKATSGSIEGFSSVTVEAGVPAVIVVSPRPVTLGANGTQQFTAITTDSSGNVLAIAPEWTIVAGGGTIDRISGLFTAGTVSGSFVNTVRASIGGLSGAATVTVSIGALASITLSPTSPNIGVGESVQFILVGKDANGNFVAITPTWSASSGGTINSATGMFTAGFATGTFVNTIQATSAGISAYATVTVHAGVLSRITITPNQLSLGGGGTQQFVALGTDVAGNAIAVTPVWSVLSGGGTIDRNGLFTAGPTAGTYTNTVQALSGGVAGFATVTVVRTPDLSLDLEGYIAGTINGQNDWTSTGAAGSSPCGRYDHAVVLNASGAYRYPEFGTKSLRISNAVESGCYTDQTFTSRTQNVAGESVASLGPLVVPGAIRQTRFDAEWAFASTVPNAEQPGLAVAVNPSRGDATRMSFVQMVDLPDGLGVNFVDVHGTGTIIAGRNTVQFVKTSVVRGLDRTRSHILRLVMDVANGAGNDVVKLYVDGALRFTGTSWENYYFYDAGGVQFGKVPPIVNRLMFRTGTDTRVPSVAAPATAGHGFLIDNIKISAYPIP